MKRSTRRQTLGSISSNSVGSHHLPNGNDRPKKQRPSRGRASMIPRVGRENSIPPSTPSRIPSKPVSTSVRRSSVGLERRHSLLPNTLPPKGDARPISDKAFQLACVKKLLKFLLERGYDHPVSQKSLSRPSGKDFTNIMTFLLRHIDPNFQDGNLKIEDEIAMNFRAMGYPFPVSKTALVAAGSPHTWPTLLAALSWLLERIVLLDCTSTSSMESHTFQSLEELESQTDRAFFQYLSSAYTAFLCGDEKTTEELELALAERFENDDEIIAKEIESVTDKNSMILEQIRNLSPGENELQELEKKKSGYATDLEQFHDLIDQMDKHVQSLHKRQNDINEELANGNQRLKSINSHLENLSDCVKKQDLLPEDVLAMQNEMKGVIEARDRIRSVIYNHQESLMKTQTDAETLSANLNNLISTYNVNVDEVAVGGDSTNEAPEKRLCKEDILLESTSGTQAIAVHQTYTAAQRTAFKTKLEESKLAFQKTLDDLERSTEGFSDALQKLRIMESKLDKCDETLEAEKKTSDAKLRLRLRDAESMEEMVASLRDPLALEEQMAHYERQCASLETLKITDEQENARRVQELLNELDFATTAMSQFENHCREISGSVENYRQDSFRRTL